MSSLCYDEIWSHPGKSLKDHLENVAKIAKFIIETLPLNLPIEKRVLKDIIYFISLYHDIGKATSFFQNYLKEKDSHKKNKLKNLPENKHSLISAIATYFVIEEYLKDIKFRSDFYEFLPISSFIVVRRHHTDLKSVYEDIRIEREDILRKQVKNFPSDYLSFLPYWERIYKKLKFLPESWNLRSFEFRLWLRKNNKGICPYFLINLFYSILLDADKHEATIGTYPKRQAIPKNIIEKYRNLKGFAKPAYDINRIREEIYCKVLNQVKNINLYEDHILSLSAPTGSGKTLTSFAFALELRNRIIKEKKYIPRIIYCLPFLSIIDQNAKIIEEIFKTMTGKAPLTNIFLVHHHLSDYVYKGDSDEYEPEVGEILIEGWDSEIIVTTFVQLFHTLFSNKNRAIRKFNKIAGSIIILDEIQTFPHKYWLLFKETAKLIGKYLNTYFILSTATQPAIFENPKELVIDNDKYFAALERTQIVFKIKKEMTISDLGKNIVAELEKTKKSIMIILNTVSAAEELFKLLKEPSEKLGYEVYFLSTHVVPYERIRRIEQIKRSTNKKIIISTQLIEAGVDIDLEKVIRDLGPMDSINQAAGRANRNWRRSLGEVEIYMLKDAKNKRFFYSYIYDPVLIDNTKKTIESYSIISEKDFLKLINAYYKRINQAISEDTSNAFLDAIKTLNYDEIGRFALIEERGEKIDIYVELNDEATNIWDQYQKIIKIADPIKRKSQFLRIKRKFYQYVISILTSKAKENLPPENSGIRYIGREQLKEFYDPETGFKTKGDVVIW